MDFKSKKSFSRQLASLDVKKGLWLKKNVYIFGWEYGLKCWLCETESQLLKRKLRKKVKRFLEQACYRRRSKVLLVPLKLLFLD